MLRFYLAAAFEAAFGDFVHGDQVDVYHRIGQAFFEQIRKRLRVLFGIVLPVDQSVLETDPSAGLLLILAARGEQLRDTVSFIDRHYRASLLVGRRVKRYRKRDRQSLAGKSLYAGHEAAGG